MVRGEVQLPDQSICKKRRTCFNLITRGDSVLKTRFYGAKEVEPGEKSKAASLLFTSYIIKLNQAL